MPFSLDPEIAEGLAALSVETGEPEPIPVGDVRTRRVTYDRLQASLHERIPACDDVTVREYEASAPDGAVLAMRWYTREGTRPGSAVLYIHGGGMIHSNIGIYDRPVARYVSATGVPFLSAGYRLAPEVLAPTPVTDCYACLEWLVARASELGVDPARIAIMGDSAGGGIGASLAIYARDQGSPAIAAQILIYPMLDDRTAVPDPELTPFATWDYDDNVTGWSALLGAARGASDGSPYGAAARLADFRTLPGAYIEIGELDIFRDEAIAYAQKLLAAGVSTELHVHPGAPHGFDVFLPDCELSRRVAQDRYRVLSSV